MTAVDNAFAASSDGEGRDGPRPGLHDSMLAEIEALAALVGESEEQSSAPLMAPTASIAHSRPVLIADAPTIDPLPTDTFASLVSSNESPAPPPSDPPIHAPAVEPPAVPAAASVAEVNHVPTSPGPAMEKAVPVAPHVPNAQPPGGARTPVDHPSEPVPASVAPREVSMAPAPPSDPTPMVDLVPPAVVEVVPVAPSPVIDSATPFPSGVLNDAERLVLLDAMPVSLFLIDTEANIRYTNLRTATMIGLERRELLGRNVLDFINVDDLDFVVALFNGGPDFADKLMGPSRIRYVDSRGQSHWTQVWAQSSPPELGVEGYIITLTNESVRDVLATAVSSVVDDDSLDHTLAAVALSARALPFEARGALLMADSVSTGDQFRFRMIGDWPIDHGAINAMGTPWRKAFTEERSADVDDVAVSGLTPAARDMLRSSGVDAMFVRPISELNGSVVGVLVVFRDDVGAASPNQNDHLEDAVRLAGLAIAQDRRRFELEQAALRDALTGVGNRAAFNERLKTERRALDVLFIDLDHFKTVNDTFGHDTGDQVIAIAAARIDAAVRQKDAVYRTGGDEFVVLCDASGEDSTERVALAQRIVDELQLPFVVGADQVCIGATVGIAAAGARSMKEAVQAADRALYLAKERGRSGWAHDDS